MRKTALIINCIIIILLFSQPFFASLPSVGDGEGLTHFPSPDPSGGVAASIASEEENIDSFDVNPKSGRWNVTNDNNTDDLVTDSILRMTTINNLTSDDITSAVGYEMNRGTTKTDGKVEYRMAASGGGNQTEYFRDELGDKCDWEEGDDESLSGFVSESIASGVYTGTTAAAASESVFIDVLTDVMIASEIYHTIEFKVKSNVEDLTGLVFFTSFKTGVSTAIVDSTFFPSTEWQVFTIDLTLDSDWVGGQSFTRIRLDEVGGDGNLEATDQLMFDYIEFIGDLDYATHIENEIEDTWDWEDSNEYWYTEESNVSDFNDGTTEGWVGAEGSVIAEEDGWLNIEDDDMFFITKAQIEATGLTVDASIYEHVAVEMISNITLTGITFQDSADNVLLVWGAIAANTYTLIYGQFDADWTGVETELKIFMQALANEAGLIKFNMTYLYDVELGDVEGWSGLERQTVNPQGFLQATMAAGIADIFVSPTGLSIDTSLFEILKVRMNTSDITMDFIIEADLGSGVVIVSSPIDLDSTSQTVYEIDLSDDSDWIGTCIKLQIRFDEQDDILDGDEIVFIDYILLLGHWDDSESVIGLFDQDNLIPLLNVSIVFTSNNSHPTTSDKAYFTVELLDLDGDVAYSAISANYTDISDLWTQYKITFDVLRSRLTVTINADNLTRIDKWTFPVDFTALSARIPALFSHEKNPYVFTSTFCQAISWQEMKLDYIKADYKEREWTQIENPTDDFIHDSWDGCRESDDSDQSIWEINIPSLDAYSGSITANTTDNSLQNDSDNIQIGVELYGVDANDGDKHLIAGCSTGFVSAFPAYVEYIYGEIYDGDFSEQYEEKRSIATVGSDVNPLLIFSLLMKQDRTIGSLKVRYYPDTEITNNFIDWMVDFTVSDYVNDPSQEFTLQVFHNFNSIPATYDAFTIVESFAWMERDRLTGFPGQVEAPTSTGGGNNWLAMIFIELGRFIADAFSFVLDPLFATLGLLVTAIGSAILVMQNAVTAAVNQIQGWLTTLGSTIGTAINQIQGWLNTIAATISSAIDQIQGWLNTIATTISDAIADIAADIWSAFGTAASGIMDDIIAALTGLAADVADFIDSLIQFLIPLLLAIASDLAGLVVGIIDQLLLIGGDILAGIITFIAGAVFFFWEALGLPDVLAILDMMLTPIFETITGIPQAILDFIAFFTPLFIVLVALYWFWLIFLAFAQEGFDPFAGLAESFGRLFTTLDFSIAGFGPIPFPIALFFIPLTYFLILPPESMFAIW